MKIDLLMVQARLQAIEAAIDECRQRLAALEKDQIELDIAERVFVKISPEAEEIGR